MHFGDICSVEALLVRLATRRHVGSFLYQNSSVNSNSSHRRIYTLQQFSYRQAGEGDNVDAN